MSLCACVLIAEDEILIADLLEASLDEEGFKTIVAYSGAGAMGELLSTPTGFGVLVTDIRVGAAPDGWALARAARKADPAIDVIYITGDSMGDWKDNGVPGSILISKPFDVGEVVRAVSALLERKAVGQ
jgi:DNA-binding response OmpR family regulator